MWLTVALALLPLPHAPDAGPGSPRPDAGTRLRADAAPAPAALPSGPTLDRNDLLPEKGPFDPSTAFMAPFHQALREDLIHSGVSPAVLMVKTTSIDGMPELAVSILQGAPVAEGNVILRRYKKNVWVQMDRFIHAHPKWRSDSLAPEAMRAAVGAASREVDVARAELDAEAVQALTRIWGVMLERARPDPPPRRRVIVFDHVKYHFQDRQRSGMASGREEGSSARRLIAIGNLLADYATTPPPQRKRLRDEMVAAAAALEASLRLPAADPR